MSCVTVPENATAMQRAILRRIQRALSENPELADAYCKMLGSTRAVSLRTLDWLVTNYAKRVSLRIVTNGRPVYVHDAYRTALAAFRRRNFDPFCRTGSAAAKQNSNVEFIRADGRRVRTSVAQLNFFEWAHRMGVLEYAREFAGVITSDMNAASARQRARRQRNKIGRRAELSSAPQSRCQAFVLRTSIDVS